LYYHRENLSEDRFKSVWSKRRPIVVKGTEHYFQSRWTPQSFALQFGETVCEIENCESGEIKKEKLANFFSMFGEKMTPHRPSLKLKDWPPKDRFKDLFPILHQDFEAAVPVPAYTTSRGVMNLAAHFPATLVAPDIGNDLYDYSGPKMYIALGSVFDDQHSGSTRLHLDLSDAVNILMWASRTADDRPGSALWHIFAKEDAPDIRKFLRTIPGDSGRLIGDPIHDQSTYLTKSSLDQLYSRFGVRPYIIRQFVGDAVFIPAGCAHQVCNLADCIKIASDFVSPESVPICKSLSQEFRIQRLTQGWPADVIPFEHMLYNTWIS
ncbi:hypothetical protein OH76DRAFT_1334154, partial [Lentinus brumalis]